MKQKFSATTRAKIVNGMTNAVVESGSRSIYPLGTLEYVKDDAQIIDPAIKMIGGRVSVELKHSSGLPVLETINELQSHAKRLNVPLEIGDDATGYDINPDLKWERTKGESTDKYSVLTCVLKESAPKPEKPAKKK